MSIKYSGLHHVSVIVADLEKSLDFYIQVLGMTQDDSRPDLGYQGAWLQVGEQQIHLLALPNPDSTTDRPDHVGRDRHTALSVNNIDAVILRLEQANIDYTKSKSGRAAIFFRDPDGNGLEFVEKA